MTRILFVLLLSFSTFSLCAQEATKELTCKDFHVGSFQLIGKKSHILLTRTLTKQTEVNTKTGDEFVYDIKWIDDCRFELTPTTEEDQEFFKGKTFLAEITSTNSNSYTCKAGFVGEKTKVIDEIKKIQ